MPEDAEPMYLRRAEASTPETKARFKDVGLSVAKELVASSD
jgi:hypothetical protein